MKLNALAIFKREENTTTFSEIFKDAKCFGLHSEHLAKKLSIAAPRNVTTIHPEFEAGTKEYFSGPFDVDLSKYVALNKPSGAAIDIGCGFVTPHPLSLIYLAVQVKDYSWDLGPAKVHDILQRAFLRMPGPTLPALYSRFAAASEPSLNPNSTYPGYAIVAANPSFFGGLKSHPMLSMRVYLLNIQTKGQFYRLVVPEASWTKTQIASVVGYLYTALEKHLHSRRNQKPTLYDAAALKQAALEVAQLADAETPKDLFDSVKFSGHLIFPADLDPVNISP